MTETGPKATSSLLRRYRRQLAFGSLFFLCISPLLFREVRFRVGGLAYWGPSIFRYVTHLSAVDEAQLCLLTNPTNSSASDRINGWPIVRTLTLKGIHAVELAAVWRSLPMKTDPRIQYLCHIPTYGVRFRANGHLVLESSLCWICENVTLPGWSGREYLMFDVNSAASSNLLATFESSFPYGGKLEIGLPTTDSATNPR